MTTVPLKLFQPSHFDTFRCIGSACEDTCCTGWTVHVDKATYGKYQACSDPPFGASIDTLIHINPKSSSDDDYAEIALKGATCPFLSENHCSVQQKLGEGYLSNMCATYPRVMTKVGDVLQRSLDLSCPEAARVVLLNPKPIEFEDGLYEEGSFRPGNIPSLDTSSLKGSPDPVSFFRNVQRLVTSLLQDRSYPVWKRLLMVGRVCEKLDETGSEDFDMDGLDRGALEEFLAERPAEPKVQLETILELIVARITTDANPRRFLECYKEFMDGIQWTSKSTMNEIGMRYAEALTEYYAPFLTHNEHMLEHYLVNYVHRTLFPFGVAESNQRLRNNRVPSLMATRYMLMAAYYAIAQGLLVGSAAFHKEEFSADHALKAIQSCTKTFEHSLTYPERAIAMLAEKHMTTPASLCVLIRN